MCRSEIELRQEYTDRTWDYDYIPQEIDEKLEELYVQEPNLFSEDALNSLLVAICLNPDFPYGYYEGLLRSWNTTINNID